jgi:hypothetical protein
MVVRDEHEDDDEVLALQPHMQLHESTFGFSKFHMSAASGRERPAKSKKKLH